MLKNGQRLFGELLEWLCATAVGLAASAWMGLLTRCVAGLRTAHVLHIVKPCKGSTVCAQLSFAWQRFRPALGVLPS